MNVLAMQTLSPTASINTTMMPISQTGSIKGDNLAYASKMDTSSHSPPSSAIGDGSGCSPNSSNEADDYNHNKREPDTDAIKMFVGQVPKNMEESELKEMFSKHGDIYQLNVLRDKTTGTHRGCCFVTFFTRKAAIMAQDELHGRVTLPGMHHPIQMKPADNEKKNVEDRKLFIGMISKKLQENDIKTMFHQFGTIDDCMILRDTSGASRGCAFVTYAVRQSALAAIQAMHHNVTMEGCASPIVVKFADTQKDKDVRIKLPANNNILSASPYPSSAMPTGMSAQQYLALLHQLNSGAPITGGIAIPAGPLTNIDMASIQNYHNMQSMGMIAGQNLIGIPAISGSPLSMTRTVTSPTTGHAFGVNTMAGSAKMSSSPSSSSTGIQVAPANQAAPQAASGGAMTAAQMQQQFAAAGAPVQPQSLAGYPAHALGGGTVAALPTQHSIDATLTQAYSGVAQYTASFPQAYAPMPTALPADTPAGKQTEGPDGANLFIYHLPQEFTDCDLLQAFQSFGNVVSSKVFIDKQTNLSKCFGFVSFDNASSAQQAIATMNGFQIGMKRLKVQLKRPKNENKPYCVTPIMCTPTQFTTDEPDYERSCEQY